MSGIQVEPSVIDGQKVWQVISLDDRRIVARGSSASEAVKNMEDEFWKEEGEQA